MLLLKYHNTLHKLLQNILVGGPDSKTPNLNNITPPLKRPPAVPADLRNNDFWGSAQGAALSPYLFTLHPFGKTQFTRAILN